MYKIFLSGILAFSIGANAITLNELIKQALKSSPYIKEKQLEIYQSKYEAKKAKANRFGKLEAFSTAFRYEDKRILYPIATPVSINNLVGARDQFILGIDYYVPIFTGFKTIESIKISSLKENLSKIDYSLTKNQLIYNIKSTYTKVLELQKQKEAIKNYLKALKKLKEDINLAVQQGKKAEVDILKVEAQIKETESNLDKIGNSINYLKYYLKTLVGNENLDLSKLDDVKKEDIKLSNFNINNLEKIQKLSVLEKIQKKKVKMAKGEYLPKVYFLASAQRNMGAGEYKDLWQIGVKLNYTIFDFGKRKNEYLKSKLELSKISIQKQKTILNIKSQIQKALSDIKSADSKIKALKERLKFLRKIEDIEKTKYEEGISDLYNYLYAKAQTISAESSYYTAIYEKQRAIYYLKFILEEYKDEEN